MAVAVRIVIGIPHQGTVKAPTVLSLVGLVGQSPHPVMLAMHEGPFIQENRTKIVHTAIKADATHVFFLDSDIQCPDDTLNRLLAHDLPIVGAMYNTRQTPSVNTVKMEVETAGADLPTELFECHAMGAGCLLIRMEVFAKIKSQGWQWFAVRDDDGIVVTGEDVWFCERARAAGYAIHCDPTIKVVHVGDCAF